MSKLFKVNEEFATVKTVEELITKAGLDWTVEQTAVYREDGKKIPNAFANVRKDTDHVFGIVSSRYKIVQNKDAFTFVDNLVGDVKFEDAGSLFGGAWVYLQADLDDRYLTEYDNNVQCKLVFTNGHDGFGALKVNIVPIIDGKVFNIPAKGVKRNFNANHTTKIAQRMALAKNTLDVAKSYLKAVMNDTVTLGKTRITETQKTAFVEAMFPVTNQTTDRSYNNLMEKREDLKARIKSDTALGLVLATSDFIENADAQRKTKTYADKKYQTVVANNTMLDKAYKLAFKMFVEA